MANFLVGEIFIQTAHNSHTLGDRFEIFYDPDTVQFEVEENDVVVLTASGIFDNFFLSIYTQRIDTGFTFKNGDGKRVVFDRINLFPFYQKRVTDIVETGINDVKLSVVSVVNESFPGAGNGSIIVSATGSNPPYQYSKGGSNFTTTTTFSSLFASTYVIGVRDSVGYFDYQTVVVDNTALSETDLAVKYRGDFKTAIVDGAESAVIYRLDIKKSGYSGSINDLSLGETPIIISARAEGSQPGVDVTIISHEVTVSIESETAKQYHEFAQSGEYEYQILIYRDNSVAKDGTDFELRFKGFITPESYTEEFGSAPYLISFFASDRLGDLGSVEYRPGLSFLTKRQSSEYRGLASQISIIQKCLEQVAPQYPFRIAVDMYETNMSTTNTSPLHQAYILQEVYYKNGSAKSCGEVIANILRPYGAILLLWEGYYYIIKEEQFKQTSIAYNEFGVDLAYDTNGTISGRVAFKARGNSTFFRWAGSQSLGFTQPVYSININADGYIREGGVMDALDQPIALNPYNYIDLGLGLGEAFPTSSISGFRGYELIVGNNIYQSASQGGWKIKMVDETPSETYIRKTGEIEFTSLDEWNLSFKVLINFNIGGVYVGINAGSPAVYLIMKWQFKLGSNYLQVDGTWTTTPTINQFFIEKDQVNKFIDFEIGGVFPIGVTESEVQDYEFKLYAVSAWEYDTEYTDKATMIAAMKTLADSGVYTSGSRRIVRVPSGIYYYYYYYEYRIDEEAANDGIYSIKATTGADRYWYLIGSWWEQVASGAGILTGNTDTIFKDLKLETFPSGDDPPQNFELISKINTVRNAKNLDIDLFHFDLQNSINNEENIYLNYIRLSDGTPTTLWSRLSGTEKTIQENMRDRLYELYKTPRYKMNAKFYSDVEISILNHLYDAGDDGRIFLLNGIEINPKKGLHSGEILEIYQDNTAIAGQFNDDFDIDNEFA
jgi:hypothetical protein